MRKVLPEKDNRADQSVLAAGADVSADDDPRPNEPKTAHRKKPSFFSRQLEPNDEALSALVKAWVERHSSDEVNKDIRRTFIETEFEDKLQTWRTHAQSWRAAQISIWLLVATLGLLISVFAGFKTGHGFTIIAGALVATLTTLTNAIHPSKKADGFLAGCQALRDEGWSLLNRNGEYNKLHDDEQRYEHFARTAHKILETKRTATKIGSVE